tara:strand:+ start:30 stop:509 length:480 start_codon:yes stop_codon:yes gene_type:complete
MTAEEQRLRKKIQDLEGRIEALQMKMLDKDKEIRELTIRYTEKKQLVSLTESLMCDDDMPDSIMDCWEETRGHIGHERQYELDVLHGKRHLWSDAGRDWLADMNDAVTRCMDCTDCEILRDDNGHVVPSKCKRHPDDMFIGLSALTTDICVFEEGGPFK